MKQAAITLAIALSALVGCTTYPPIDETIAYLDSNPMPIVFRPIVGADAIAPLSREALVGRWEADFDIYDRYLQAFMVPEVQKKTGFSIEQCYVPDSVENEVYSFDASGTYEVKTTIKKAWFQDWNTPPLIETGRWTYDNGELVLNSERRASGDYSTNVKEMKKYKVLWFGADEISIRKCNTDVLGSREVYIYDKRGSEKKRVICVTGEEDGVQVGWVAEYVRSPAHFRKTR